MPSACAILQPLRIVFLLAIGLATACSANRSVHRPQPPPLVQPGAPGAPTRPITTSQATALSRVPVTEADVRFMQGMIGHHAQALEMTALIPTRTSREDLRLLGRRIELSQADEIKMMQAWLAARGQMMPDSHVHELMPGMLTPDEMNRLAEARGREFERLFLESMIRHHDGALVMVKGLFETPDAGQDSEIFAFASEVDLDQRMEIGRMAAMLMELKP